MEIAKQEYASEFSDHIMDKFYDPSVGMKNIAMTGLMILMAPENNLLDEDPELYEKGLDLVTEAAMLKDNEQYSYWTVRYCALHILANTLEQTKDRPEYECFYTRAFETVKNNEKDNDRKTKILAKGLSKKYSRERRF